MLIISEISYSFAYIQQHAPYTRRTKIVYMDTY